MFKLKMAVVGCVLSLHAMAQFNVRGTVRDAKSNEALVGATVQVENQNRYAITDQQGWFEISRVAAGQQTLVIKFLGYQEKREQQMNHP